MKYWLALSVCILAGCVTEPSRDEPYPTPVIYATWWAEISHCAGQTTWRSNHLSINQLDFYTLDPMSRFAGRQFGLSIWIRERFKLSRLVVEHEMLHVLIDDPNHRDERWARCNQYPFTVTEALGS